MRVRETGKAGRFVYASASFILICSVVTMSLNLPASALSLGDNTIDDGSNTGLLTPVTNIVSQITDTVLPAVTQPIDQTILPGTTDAVQSITAPVTDAVLPAVTDTVDTVAAPVTPIVQNTTAPVLAIVSPVTDNLLPTVANNVVAPVLTTVTSPLQPSSQTPQPALSIPRLASKITLASAQRPAAVTTPASLATVASFTAPSVAQTATTNSSFDPMSLITNTISFFTAWPATFESLANNTFGKRLDNSSVMLLTGILGAMLIIFVAMIYMMIARGKYGMRTMGHNFMHETTMYGSMAKISAVAFGTLGIGSVAIYLMLLTL